MNDAQAIAIAGVATRGRNEDFFTYPSLRRCPRSMTLPETGMRGPLQRVFVVSSFFCPIYTRSKGSHKLHRSMRGLANRVRGLRSSRKAGEHITRLIVIVTSRQGR